MCIREAATPNGNKELQMSEEKGPVLGSDAMLVFADLEKFSAAEKDMHDGFHVHDEYEVRFLRTPPRKDEGVLEELKEWLREKHPGLDDDVLEAGARDAIKPGSQTMLGIKARLQEEFAAGCPKMLFHGAPEAAYRIWARYLQNHGMLAMAKLVVCRRRSPEASPVLYALFK